MFQSFQKVLKEHVDNIYMVGRLARYETKSQYSNHYLGIVWEFLNPLFQIAVYWFVFGIGLRSGNDVDGVPFLPWMIVGISLWFFVSKAFVQGSNSIYARLNLVSKMNFPMSIIPSYVMLTFFIEHAFILLIIGVVLIGYDIPFSIYILQLPYYLVATFLLSYAFALLFSTFSTLARDFQSLLQSMVRMLFYVTPILWPLTTMPEVIRPILQLNPINYVIEGYRNTFFYHHWFWEHPGYMLYFWSFVAIILLIAAALHVKFRDSFTDYL